MAKSSLLLVLLLLLTILQNTCAKIHITDDLDDVEDNEEDDTWKEWGQKKKKVDEKFDPPPEDLEKMDIGKMQEEMMKRQVGPSFGFVKLRIGVIRTTPRRKIHQ
ncbi:hypothetical protein Tco_1276687 [Tanacetum coccineum]